MPKVKANNIELEYETFGDPSSKPLLFVMGLGAQMITWLEEFIMMFVDKGFYVIRFDNRDVGLSTKFEEAGVPDIMKEFMARQRGETISPPYTVEDMADDAVGLYYAFAREAYRAMVDIDEEELNKPTLHFHMQVHADAKFFLEEMLHQIGDEEFKPKQQWLSWCQERKNTLPGILQDNSSNPQYVNSYVLAETIFNLLEPGSLVVTGNGTAYTGTFQIMNLKKDVRVFTNQGCASMGYDIPAAIGACFARNKEPVVLITGDGSIQMNIQELGTIAFHKLPIKIFVLNNDGYLAMRITQDTYFESRYIASDPQDGVTCPDLCGIAKAYGLQTVKLENENNLSAKIGEILNMPGPVLCEVLMDPKQTLYPKLSSEVKPNGRLISKPLEDLYPFLDRDEFRRNMIIEPLNE